MTFKRGGIVFFNNNFLKTSDPQSFDDFAERYDAAASIGRRYDFFLQNFPRKRGSVLDVGCGPGLFALELSKHFESVTGMDLSEPMLAIARKKRSAGNVTYLQADANHLKLDSQYDCIVSHTTFHHLNDVPAVLSALKSALAPGGRLILIDVVNRWPRFLLKHSLFYHVLHRVAFPIFIARHGWSDALTILRFGTSKAWIEHLKSDHYLSASDFRELYGQSLPGAAFTRSRFFMGVVWEKPEGR